MLVTIWLSYYALFPTITARIPGVSSLTSMSWHWHDNPIRVRKPREASYKNTVAQIWSSQDVQARQKQELSICRTLGPCCYSRHGRGERKKELASQSGTKDEVRMKQTLEWDMELKNVLSGQQNTALPDAAAITN
jgi:hypothetical protein